LVFLSVSQKDQFDPKASSVLLGTSILNSVPKYVKILLRPLDLEGNFWLRVHSLEETKVNYFPLRADKLVEWNLTFNQKKTYVDNNKLPWKVKTPSSSQKVSKPKINPIPSKSST